MSHILGYLKGLIVLSMGLGAVWSYWVYQHKTLWILLLGIFIAYHGINILYQGLKQRFDIIHHQQHCAQQNFQYYIQNNPQHIQGDVMSCNQCNSQSIRLHIDHRAAEKQLLSRVQPGIYHRHQCKQCAAVLFYSPFQG